MSSAGIPTFGTDINAPVSLVALLNALSKFVAAVPIPSNTAPVDISSLSASLLTGLTGTRIPVVAAPCVDGSARAPLAVIDNDPLSVQFPVTIMNNPLQGWSVVKT